MASKPHSFDAPSPAVNVGYAATELQRALDAFARGDSSGDRVRRWLDATSGLLSGAITAGARQPVARYPAWVTLEVTTGGFATGRALAAGPLRAHEEALLSKLGHAGVEAPRLALNRYFLSDAGLALLNEAIESRRFSMEVAEESALPIVAWLVKQGHAEAAERLVTEIAPFAHELRFYPSLTETCLPDDGRVHLESVGEVAQRLSRIGPNARVQAQTEAIEVWAPLYDDLVSLFLETVDGEAPVAAKDENGAWQRGGQGQFVVHGGWPLRREPTEWKTRAGQLLASIQQARAKHTLSGKATRSNETFAFLVSALERAVDAPDRMTGREVGRIRLVLARYVAKRGTPGSQSARAFREHQRSEVAGKPHHQLAAELALRLADLPANGGLDDVDAVLRPAGSKYSPRAKRSMERRLLRCVSDSPLGLIQRGVVSSAEVLARLIPQRTGHLRAASLGDGALRVLYAATYRAFRRRRSLLLLNLQKQIQIEELPWIAAIEAFRAVDATSAQAASQALNEFASIAIEGFPQTMLPNKLLQEFSALALEAGESLPLTEELAADIFMGRFSPKFTEAVHIAGQQLRGSLYACYYRLDWEDILSRIPKEGEQAESRAPDPLAVLCAERAGETLGTWRPASNGRILEEQLIITSHNLALLFGRPDIRRHFSGRTHELAQACFEWVLNHLQLPTADWRTELQRIKNAAYAWRQMVFFLSLDPSHIQAFFTRAEDLLGKQPADFAARFRPALQGLKKANDSSEQWLRSKAEPPFLGWRDSHRWRRTSASEAS